MLSWQYESPLRPCIRLLGLIGGGLGVGHCSWIRSVAVVGARIEPRAWASLPEPQHYLDESLTGIVAVALVLSL